MFEKYLKENCLLVEDVLDIMIFENEILKKRLNNQPLNEKEKFFSCFVSPTSIIKDVLQRERSKKN